ncbi:MAG: YbaB/EbfC family nucleoid-associated protein [Alphaproteobacteria bacterium]|nr:YbaB/EbfC family nucleoid-associated protein [Alphaproteobacteria bacterium]
MNNMQQILARAQKLQAKVGDAQKKFETEEFMGTAGSGAVSVVLNGRGEAKSVSLSKDVVDPEEKDMLEDLILAALNDAKSRYDTRYAEIMKDATGGINLPGIF